MPLGQPTQSTGEKHDRRDRVQKHGLMSDLSIESQEEVYSTKLTAMLITLPHTDPHQHTPADFVKLFFTSDGKLQQSLLVHRVLQARGRHKKGKD